jgi:hypothetical protein
VATALLVGAGLLALMLALLAVPVELAFDGAFDVDVPASARGELALGWMFGIVRVRLRPPRRRAAARPAPKAKAEPQRRARRGAARRRAVELLRQAAFRRRLWQLVADLLHALHPQDLRLRMRIGLGDPADTGVLWAIVGPLGVAVQRSGDVSIEPDFAEAALAVEARGRLRGVPLRVVALLAGFLLSQPVRGAWRRPAAAEA